jgi:hypothetical protein
MHSEKDIFVPKKFSDKRENLKNMREIIQQAPEKLFVF